MGPFGPPVQTEIFKFNPSYWSLVLWFSLNLHFTRFTRYTVNPNGSGVVHTTPHDRRRCRRWSPSSTCARRRSLRVGGGFGWSVATGGSRGGGSPGGFTGEVVAVAVAVAVSATEHRRRSEVGTELALYSDDGVDGRGYERAQS
ncbi:hypothetical protein TIFTF001_033079 [Ficus carica]|uniref:Uncharacterized protein n=1 Tax=Ficus carica TaxID=3494 RepID=A0AA88E4M7_FICCA|nr:hypothetical protein TIFTF001_033079 [Ficus carica]